MKNKKTQTYKYKFKKRVTCGMHAEWMAAHFMRACMPRGPFQGVLKLPNVQQECGVTP